MPIKTNEREYRDIYLKNIEIRKLDDGKEVVEGYATTWDEYMLWEDGEYRMFEKFDMHAYDQCDMDDVIMQLNHEGRVLARISNGTLTVTPDEHGLRIRAYLGGTEEGRRILEEIKGGYMTKMSQGFRVKTDKREVIEDRENRKVDIHRTVMEVKKLYDVSVVSIPANDATEISARNTGEGVIAEVKQELLAIAARERKKQQIAITAKSI